jgi:hypothetical protein
MTQHVVTVQASMMPRSSGMDNCPSGFTFEVFRGEGAECQDIASRVGGVYSDMHYLGLTKTSVITAEAWNDFIERYA